MPKTKQQLRTETINRLQQGMLRRIEEYENNPSPSRKNHLYRKIKATKYQLTRMGVKFVS